MRDLCEQDNVDGLLLQLPLPSHLDEEAVIDAFDPSKDVDGFHPLNVGYALLLSKGSSSNLYIIEKKIQTLSGRKLKPASF